MKIQFANVEVVNPLRHRRKVKEFLGILANGEGSSIVSLQYVFCGDDYMLEINRQFLGHDTFTDIITFDLGDAGSAGIEGEIYISVERVKENAAQFGVSIQQEMLRVIFHGLLHLLGYKDKTKAQVDEMRSKEDEYLKKFNSWVKG
ncbi:MAG TPA: rRNA maturation RNase YbeY [Phnomibacter sp.]|mgnify:CR=1 FL=1|nr:rRNA maturation RNase YbeY [Phnomibacter sp.]